MIGALFGRPSEAEALAGDYEQAIAELREAAARLPERDVIYLIWKEPWMTVSQDTYISRLLALGRWYTLCHDPDTRYPEVDPTPELLGQTDFVLFSSEPYAFTPSDIDDFRAAYACGEARLLPIDGEMVSWYGSRAIRGARYLKQLAQSVA